jgi:hypothetical protein
VWPALPLQMPSAVVQAAAVLVLELVAAAQEPRAQVTARRPFQAPEWTLEEARAWFLPARSAVPSARHQAHWPATAASPHRVPHCRPPARRLPPADSQ